MSELLKKFATSLFLFSFWNFHHLAELGPDPFSGGKPCSANTDCNQALGVSCCGAGEASARCCPDGLCMICEDTSDQANTFHFCGTYCPDHAKTTQSTPPYMSTTTPNTTMFEFDEEFGFLLLDYEDEDDD